MCLCVPGHSSSARRPGDKSLPEIGLDLLAVVEHGWPLLPGRCGRRGHTVSRTRPVARFRRADSCQGRRSRCDAVEDLVDLDARQLLASRYAWPRRHGSTCRAAPASLASRRATDSWAPQMLQLLDHVGQTQRSTASVGQPAGDLAQDRCRLAHPLQARPSVPQPAPQRGLGARGRRRAAAPASRRSRSARTR